MVEVAGCVNIPLPRIQRLLDVCRKHFCLSYVKSDLEIEIVELYNDFFFVGGRCDKCDTCSILPEYY